jgi:hypothetical protein
MIKQNILHRANDKVEERREVVVSACNAFMGVEEICVRDVAQRIATVRANRMILTLGRGRELIYC